MMRMSWWCSHYHSLAGANSLLYGLAGEQVNVKYDDVAHSIVDLNAAGTVTYYCWYWMWLLVHTDSDRIKSLTVNDTAVNRDTVTAMTGATEQAAEAEGFGEITVLAFNQIYQFNITQGGTETEIISAQTGSTNATVGASLMI